jgi:hypothetical protein
VLRLDEDGFNDFFPIIHCQPTDRRSVIGDYLRKVRKGRGQYERREKELCKLINILN